MSCPPQKYNGKFVKPPKPFMVDGEELLPYYTRLRLLPSLGQGNPMKRTPPMLTKNNLNLFVR